MRGDSYDEKADVYSFGVLLLDMAAGDGFLRFLLHRYRMEHGPPSPAGSAAPNPEEVKVAMSALRGA